jgi:SAM-dependent methyltransferase
MRVWHFLFKNIALVDDILKQQKSTIRILDIGCSAGYLRRFLEGNVDPKSKKKIFYWGLDVRQDLVTLAVKGVDDIESGAKGNLVPSLFIAHDVKHGLPFKNNYFDYVVNFEMIKYLPIEQGKKLIAEIYRVLDLSGDLYLSTSYSSNRPGFMKSVPFEQIEKILVENGFKIAQRRGSQASFNRLSSHLKEAHLPMVKDLLTVHPPEMVAAMITPLYPYCADQVTFHCKIKE